MKDKYLITIIIVHYRKLNQLKRTVDCLFNNTSTPFKLKILNQAYEKDGIKEYLTKLQRKKNVEVIFNKENTGCSPGRHTLSKNITTPYILSLDDDIYVNKDWDKPIFEQFKKNKDIGAIGFSLYRIDDSFWVTGGRNISVKNGVIKTKRPHIDPKKNKHITFYQVNDLSAGAMIYKKELEKIIPWNVNYFIGFEDLEKGLHFKRSKYKFFVSVQSKFIHDKISEDPKYEDYNKSRRDYHKMRESYLYFLKNNKVRIDMKRHIFYKYVCRLPNFFLRHFIYFWLKVKKMKGDNR